MDKKKRFEKKVVTPHKISLEEVGPGLIRKSVIVEGCIEKVMQTGGPTVFDLTDGTGNLSLKGFIAPGERAYPNIDAGDCVVAVVRIDEFNGEIEGNIDKIEKKTGEARKVLMQSIEQKQRTKAKVTQDSFMVNDKILTKLKDRIVKAAEEIRLAVIQSRPIIVRHHNDCDGYSAGFALERAILPLIEKQHIGPKAGWEYFTRAPCKAPLYELEDSIKDTANSLRNVAKFSNKMPLVIIADNGSSEDDLMAIQQGKIHGADFIVIDHHGFDKDVISAETLVHINPFLVEESGSSYSAGMLCSELARFINPDVKNMEQIPALTGLTDRIDLENPKTVKIYLENAAKEGYTEELLRDIGLVMDFVARKLRFMEAREYIEVMFGEPRDKQKELVALMAPYIKKLDAKGLAIGKVSAVVEKVGNVNVQTIYVEESFPGFGFYPNPGRAISLLHENFLNENSGEKALITMGVMNTGIIFRATDAANFSVHEVKETVEKKLPSAFVAGGGHKNAGSLSFLPKSRDEVLKVVKDFVKGSN